MIIVVTYKEEVSCDIWKDVVSHGFDTETSERVTMQQVPVSFYGDQLTWDNDLQEFVLCDV